MGTLNSFDQVRDEVKGFLAQYLSKFGIDAREKKRFHCLNPLHQDKHPTNCGVIPGTDLWHCFACGMTGDIFDAAAAKENKPTTGRGFITDNLFYLARTFGVTIPELNLSDEEMFEIETRRAYAQASRYITSAKKSELITKKLEDYMWPAEVLNKIGIGTVEFHEHYMETMTKVHGHSLEFLKKVDLERKGIFNEHNLIYTIRDEHGSPIAFSARNIKYEQEWANYKSKSEQIKNDQSLTDSQRLEKLEALWKPRKYNNTTDTILFQKGRVLFNFDQAKKNSMRTLLVFEGNPDCVTLWAGGVTTSVATCGTAFTMEHLELALANGITKIVLVYDPDNGGQKGTERFVKVLEQFGNRPGLEVEIVSMPEGTDDPDAYVRAFGNLKAGVAEFRKLPRLDLFSWKLKKLIEEGADPLTMAEEQIPIIVNIENHITRLRQAGRLADATGLPKEYIQREVLRLVDVNEMKQDEERAAIAQQTVKALQQNPHAMETILATASARIEAVSSTRLNYDPQEGSRLFRETIEKMEAATDMFELVTGNPIFDGLMGGIPKEGVMMSEPGKPHHGKSIWLDNLIVGLLRNNPKLQIFLHHVDDPSVLRIPRILGVMSGLSSRLISKAGVSLNTIPDAEFEEKYRKAQGELAGWIDDERLILADAGRLVGSLPAHERWIKEVRRRNPNHHFISIGDNFHLFDMPGMEPGEGKVREMSKFIANMPTRLGMTTIFSMEVPKDTLRPGVRPKYTDAKNSGGISFDSKVNMNVFQELQDAPEDTVLTWRSSDHMEQVTRPDGSVVMVEKVLPIVEVIIDKNKVTGEKKTIFYRLEPMSGCMEECSAIEQTVLQQKLEESRKQRREQQKKSFAKDRRAF